MGGDDLNWGEKIKWGRSPLALGCALNVLPEVPLLQPPGLGEQSCHCSPGMSLDKNSIKIFTAMGVMLCVIWMLSAPHTFCVP